MYNGFYNYKRKTKMPNAIKQLHIQNLRSRLCQTKYNAQMYFTTSEYLVMAEALFDIWQILLTNNEVFVNNLKNCLTNPI
jgi:hypothetical protein